MWARMDFFLFIPVHDTKAVKWYYGFNPTFVEILLNAKQTKNGINQFAYKFSFSYTNFECHILNVKFFNVTVNEIVHFVNLYCSGWTFGWVLQLLRQRHHWLWLDISIKNGDVCKYVYGFRWYFVTQKSTFFELSSSHTSLNYIKVHESPKTPPPFQDIFYRLFQAEKKTCVSLSLHSPLKRHSLLPVCIKCSFPLDFKNFLIFHLQTKKSVFYPLVFSLVKLKRVQFVLLAPIAVRACKECKNIHLRSVFIWWMFVRSYLDFVAPISLALIKSMAMNFFFNLCTKTDTWEKRLLILSGWAHAIDGCTWIGGM